MFVRRIIEVPLNTSSSRLDLSVVILRLQWVLLFLGLVLTFVLAFRLRLPDFDWQIALGGWSAIDWVAHLQFPDRYVLDFNNGMGLYDKSSSMYVYPLANRWFGVQVEQVIPGMIFLEMVFLAGACIFFARTLSGTGSAVGGFLFALLVVVSPARDLDLSHFGAPYFWGLFYNFADGFRLLGLAFFLRRQALLGGLFLGVGFSIHPLIALFGCAFVAGFVAVERNWVGLRSLGLGVLAFLVISVGWLVYSYDFSSVVSTQMDAQVWIRMARAFSFHFFPIDYGLLTLDFHKRLLPLLVLCLLALHYLPVVCPDRALRRGLIGGCLVQVLLIAAGLAISVYVPIPSLIKLALPRASALLILIAMAICCIGLVRDIQSGTLLPRILGLLIVVSPFAYPPGFPLIPVALMILVSRRGCGVGKETGHRRVELAALVLVLAIVFAYWLARLVQPHNLPSYSGYFAQFNHWQLVALSGLLLIFLYVFDRHAKSFGASNARLTVVASSFGPLVVFVVACYLSLSWQRALIPAQSNRAYGASYLDAQRWAKSNTPEQSLFMVDPTIYYGWRDFSERSSFGNVREWLHTSWLYDSRADRYRAGLQRFAEFGIPLDPYLEKSVSRLQGYAKLTVDIQKRFYDLDEEWFSSMRQRYAVSHVVMRKESVVRNYSFDKVFENQHFVIFDLRK
jgi:hypothetical protein